MSQADECSKVVAMKEIRNILIVSDPTADAQPAVDKAAALAKSIGARVELFMCDFRAGLDARTAEADRARGILLQHRREQLELLAKPLRDAGIEVAVDATFDNPLHEGLLRKIAKSHIDLVVKDTHHHSLARRTLVTNTDWHLIRSCPAPLLLVKPGFWSKQAQTLAAVDPGHPSDKPAALDHEICEWSVTLAKHLGGIANALHAYIPSSILLTASASTGLGLSVATGAETQLIEDEKRAKLQTLRDLVAQHGIDAQRIHLAFGSAAELIPGEAERLKIDIVVMGAVSRSRMQRLFVGSTAERVLDRLPCDVLIVKPLDFASDLPF